MIWMGVGRPEDFVATLNRFPVHNQRVIKASALLLASRTIAVSIIVPIRLIGN